MILIVKYSRTTLCSLSIAAIVLSAGCSGGDGAVTQVDNRPARRANTNVDHEAYRALGYNLVWRGFPLITRGQRPEHFDVDGDVVLVEDTGNALTLIDASTGVNRWSNTVASKLTKTLGNVRVGDRIISASDTEVFVLDVRTGELLDRQNLDLVVNTKPVIVSDVAVFGSASGEVLGHSLYTGFRRWGYLLDSAIDAQPAHVGDLVGVVSSQGDVIILDPETGASTNRGRTFAGLQNRPVGSDDALFVASLDQSVYAFSAVGFDLLWRHRGERPITDQPVIHDDVLYVAIPEVGLVAFNALTGDQIWTASDVYGEAIGIRAGKLIIWDGSTAVLLDPDRGDILERVWLPDVDQLRMDEFEDGDLYTITRRGVVAKFVPRI